MSFLVLFSMWCTKGGDLDNLPTVPDVHDLEPFADNAGVAEQVPDFLGVRICRDVKVLRRFAEDKVADTATHQVCLETVLREAVHHFEGVFAYVFFVNQAEGRGHCLNPACLPWYFFFIQLEYLSGEGILTALSLCCR